VEREELIDMKIFLTGATGFLGSSLVAVLSRDTQISEIVCLVRNREKVDRLSLDESFAGKISFIYSDILDDQLDLTGIDLIIHAAAVTGVQYCQSNPELAKRVNAEGTKNLVDKARGFKVPYFIYISSLGVYGEQPKPPFTEDMTPHPGNIYALTKYAGERHVAGLSGDGLHYIILRFSRLYGAGLFRNEEQLPHKFARICREGGALPVCEGRQIMDFVNIADACRLIKTVINNCQKDIWDEIYNGGGNEPMRAAELAEMFLRASRRLGLITGGINILPLLPDEAANASRCLNIAKARKRLGWEPAVAMEQGIIQLLREDGI
jgi:UDP-glucose 4-epimerase